MRRSPLDAWIASLVARGTSADAAAADSTAVGSTPAGSIPAGSTAHIAVGSGPVFDRAALERYQLYRLRETIALARTRSSFYRRHLAAGPADLDSLDDLARLPLTSSTELRANPLSFVCVSQDEISRVVTLDTSGTTGSPKRVYFTRADQALTVDFFEAGMSVFTGPGDRVLILLPVERPGSVGDLLATAMENLGAVPIRHGPVRDPEAALRVAAGEAATVAVGVPTHLLRMVRHGPVPAPLPSLHSVLLSTDHVPTSIVNAIADAWSCRVYNHYGTTEMGLGGGVDCEARRGYHLREADMLFEVVDPVSGWPLPVGEVGEVVFTTLTRVGMPLIRYRTGDLGRWLPDPCPCGSRLRTLSHITARVDGAVAIGPAGNLTLADLDEAIFAIDGVLDFAVSVLRTGGASLETRLDVNVHVAAHRSPEAAREEVTSALADVAVIALARSSGAPISIDVVVGTEPVVAPGLAKRSMTVDKAAGRPVAASPDRAGSIRG